MHYGIGLLLTALGAILHWAVADAIDGVALSTVGVILMVVGIAWLVIGAIYDMAYSRRRGLPGDRVVEREPARERVVERGV